MTNVFDQDAHNYEPAIDIDRRLKLATELARIHLYRRLDAVRRLAWRRNAKTWDRLQEALRKCSD